jgi:hypothetical protein
MLAIESFRQLHNYTSYCILQVFEMCVGKIIGPNRDEVYGEMVENVT